MATNTIEVGVNYRRNKNNASNGFGKWYPEVDRKGTLSMRGFAQHIADHGSMWSSDVVEGVLKKITQCLPELVAQGVGVELEPLGTFFPTFQVDGRKGAVTSLANADPTEGIKAVHIRFAPCRKKEDNISGPAFKKRCSFKVRNVVETSSVTVDGKTKKVRTLTPVEDYLLKQSAQNGN